MPTYDPALWGGGQTIGGYWYPPGYQGTPGTFPTAPTPQLPVPPGQLAEQPPGQLAAQTPLSLLPTTNPLQDLLARGIAGGQTWMGVRDSKLMRDFGPDADLDNPNLTVQTSLEAMLNPNSDYIKNARQRGVEYAASRGGLNSSIAAGASERSAMEAAQPLVNAALNIQQQRESQAFNEYLSGRNLNQDFQQQLALLPLRSSYDMLNRIQEYAMMDPTLYTPEVISGYSNFFTKNSSDIINQLFRGP